MTLAAAGMAYYLFLAIFPAVIAMIGVLGLVNADTSSLENSIRNSMPGGSGAILVDAINNADRPDNSASLFTAISGIALAIWSASSGMIARNR